MWLIFMINVGKYTSPMDPMGLGHEAHYQKENINCHGPTKQAMTGFSSDKDPGI